MSGEELVDIEDMILGDLGDQPRASSKVHNVKKAPKKKRRSLRSKKRKSTNQISFNMSRVLKKFMSKHLVAPTTFPIPNS